MRSYNLAPACRISTEIYVQYINLWLRNFISNQTLYLYKLNPPCMNCRFHKKIFITKNGLIAKLKFIWYLSVRHETLAGVCSFELLVQNLAVRTSRWLTFFLEKFCISCTEPIFTRMWHCLLRSESCSNRQLAVNSGDVAKLPSKSWPECSKCDNPVKDGYGTRFSVPCPHADPKYRLTLELGWWIRTSGIQCQFSRISCTWQLPNSLPSKAATITLL
jgi:hypothetical protein